MTVSAINIAGFD